MLCLTLIPVIKGLNENTIRRFLYSKELVEEKKEDINGFKDIYLKEIGNNKNKIQLTDFYGFKGILAFDAQLIEVHLIT